MESWSRRSASGINRTESAFKVVNFFNFSQLAKSIGTKEFFYDLTKLDLDGF